MDIHAVPPRQLGRYRLIARLAAGGMSEIFLAIQNGFGEFRKPVVLKKILPAYARDVQFLRLFQSDARVTAGFTHPCIPQLFDAGAENGEIFLVMELVAGATLRELREASAPP